LNRKKNLDANLPNPFPVSSASSAAANLPNPFTLSPAARGHGREPSSVATVRFTVAYLSSPSRLQRSAAAAPFLDGDAIRGVALALGLHAAGSLRRVLSCVDGGRGGALLETALATSNGVVVEGLGLLVRALRGARGFYPSFCLSISRSAVLIPLIWSVSISSSSCFPVWGCSSAAGSGDGPGLLYHLCRRDPQQAAAAEARNPIRTARLHQGECWRRSCHWHF
jgi:hypothetical protein